MDSNGLQGFATGDLVRERARRPHLSIRGRSNHRALGRRASDPAGLAERTWHVLNVIRAGVTAGAVDTAARQVLDSEGLGAAFVHGTGHGLGLEVHEAPRLSSLSGSQELLRAGMVCTIEPGAYVPGVGGVRLEDDVLVTDTGAELLTPGPRDLLTV